MLTPICYFFPFINLDDYFNKKSGAQTFDLTKVEFFQFEPTDEAWDTGLQNPGRPVSANWSCIDGSSGVTKFDDLIDASGRIGLVSTKYFKNCKYNQGLKNNAKWGYFKNTGYYGVGTRKEDQPYFEALQGKHGACHPPGSR
ncbi:MAG: hypothetical protein LQ338_007010 [Usnochroma carphineum]|nr:MAG: hypothetical protein LQ338_007010 [Usnochroma carphineum]